MNLHIFCYGVEKTSSIAPRHCDQFCQHYRCVGTHWRGSFAVSFLFLLLYASLSFSIELLRALGFSLPILVNYISVCNV